MTPTFPWPTFREPWLSQINDLHFDGVENKGAVIPDHQTIDACDHGWTEISFAITTSTHEMIPGGLTDLTAYVLINCGATQLRRAYPMEYNSDRTSFEATVALPHGALAGKASVLAQITSDRGGRRRLVGSSVAWAIILDKSEAPEGIRSAPLKTMWVDFATGEAPQEARRNPSTYCYIDIDCDPPTLFLNSGIDGFQSLILAENAKRERRRHRDLLGAMIAKQVANSLIRAAVDEIEPDEFGAPATEPASPILREMCEALAQHLPETESAVDLYALVANLRGSGLAANKFWTEVDLALDRMTSLADTVTKVCKEVKHV